MATKFSATLEMSNSTDALFRAWVQFLDDLLIVTGGWTLTADTGQMTISTATHPSVASTKVGYRIYAMADALQATAPVYMRLDYGSSGVAASPGIWVTLGTGTDGAGTITGVFYNGGAIATATIASKGNTTNATNSYGSADAGRISALMFVDSAANGLMCFALERTKDATGADTGDGLLFTYCAGSTNTDGVNATQYIQFSGANPPVEVGVMLALPNETTSAFASNVSVGFPLHFKSVAQQPGLGFVAVNSGDFVPEASLAVDVYDATRTYQLGHSASNQLALPTGNGAKASRSNTLVGIRYD